MTEVYAGLQAPDSINPDLEAVNQDARDLGSRVFSPHASACGCGICGFRGPVSEAVVSPGGYLNLDQRGVFTPSGKYSRTIDDAATQLTRSGLSWSAAGQSITVTYAFRATMPDAIQQSDASGFSRFNVSQIRQTELALQAWSDVSGIRFTRVGSGELGESAYSDSATILFANYSAGQSGAAAFASYPGTTGQSGDVWINVTKNYNEAPTGLNYGGLTIVHEIGHAIGLDHPSNYNASGSSNITYSLNASYFEDSYQYTVMSYFKENETGASYLSSHASTPMLDDIAAVQKLYGPNMTTRTGDTVYGFSSNADRPWFQATTSSSVMIWAVWDAGGSDTFNFSGYTSSQKIDLRQGSFSDIGGLVGNVSIARGVDIENAIGGTGNDTILGNNLNNRLEGGAGRDTLQGGEGADTLIGGAGDDRYVISDTNDLITEAASEGTDTVDIAIAVAGGTYTLGANIEGAIVTSTVAYNVIGNSLNNQLYGNSASNRIEGGSGNDTLWDRGGGGDTLIGGVGDDLYYIDAPSTLVTENVSEGWDSVVVRFGSSTGAWTLSSNIETASIQVSSGGSLIGNSLDNRLEGGSGDDTLQGGAGADTLAGGSGDDLYIITDQNDSVSEATLAGWDAVEIAIAVAGGTYALDANIEGAIVTSTVAYNVIGNSLSNFLFGNAASNRIEGGSGNDTLWDGGVGGGGDSLIGGVGDDLYYIDSPSTLVVENAFEGRDSVLVRFGSSVGAWTLSSNIETASIQVSSGGSLIGNGLDNRLEGGAGNDTLQGGAGADTLEGGAGSDSLLGGSGNDYFYVNSISDSVMESSFEGYDTIELKMSSISYVYYIPFGIEVVDNYSSTSGQIHGNSANESIYGNNLSDSIFGNEGNDTLRGYSGNDYVEGGDGNDRMLENPDIIGGDDTYLAGAGNDTILETNGSNFLRGEAGDDSLSGGSGFDDMHGNMGNDSLRGGEGNDWVVGGRDNDLLFGDAGFDIVYGNMGNDTVDGGAGNDWVRGGQGDDSVMGGTGDDWIWGDRGNDTISGGAGADLFYSLAGAGIDRITDFSYAAGDRLKLEGGPSRTVSQSGADVVVDMGNGDQVILVGVSLSSLGTGWIL
ncbi:M10 family metallopeptidase C-terminal domain-containing protein [Phenylobacterium sp.]|uniref:M10 family metallopeptidase C-terminal domain-containing protein n=1 Tax=Phenylobacterium sp. TaxID=1871053 RepID=UPI0025E5BB3F|nr:M10 family metallopeptidase C-terminal domain-containing protein [Phenylobacterium sp.]